MQDNNQSAPVRTVLRRAEDRPAPPASVPADLLLAAYGGGVEGTRQDERRHALAHMILSRTRHWRRETLGVGVPR